MSEEKNEVTQVIRIDDKDWFLQSLVNMANGGVLSFGITLNVGGFLVSGELIGGKAYFEGFGSDFASGLSDSSIADQVKASFAQHGEIYSSNENPSPPAYIHLKDARFFNSNGNPIPGNRGVWWRGRISEVDGFSLGSLSA
ncbi:gas vesicle accessory protein GvpU [Plesiomonas shigelloides]|uniref:gas vesicle accessory protein GvpU n=1 Tax=Plesiomonas shigelloides TaxID=703 RepID=UPI00387EFCAD